MDQPLNSSETARWVSWKRANDAVLAAVAQEIHDAAGLSAADFAVLSRVIEEGDGRMPQQDLGAMLEWKRARLSRQLSRMADRGLLWREEAPGRRVLIVATREGRTALGAARPAHARAVRRALFERVPAPDGDAFWSALDAVAAPPRAAPPTS
ncbi:MarR family winged helix-turn-helix transcriptional regulator [Streptomyces sp. 8L]|uniref:MarR family winged helix-turn-helix transcriptional regulator n=1 Tax=Streptomyces sp. 8L TaxID=2877242 RepID=UPI001CD39798|nr:MarR family winged helix-turn-helix transcriptional regulator [Streptomyces sp. 8L]MCA1221016.1 MarR family winged helix-turn-helix transcriptional regulator [Streptomyces sp. 8L]